jgi:hypothetical protein
MMGWMSVWMVIGFLIFLALVAGAVYLVVQLTRRDPDDLASESTMRGDPPPPGAD